MGDVLVYHHSVQDGAVLQSPTWNFFHLRIPLQLESQLISLSPLAHHAHGLESQVRYHFAPLAGKLRSDAGLEGPLGLGGIEVDGAGLLLKYSVSNLEGLIVSFND